MPKAKSKHRPPRAIARSAARLGAVQALYQMEVARRGVDAVLAEYGVSRIGETFEDGDCGNADADFLKDTVRGVLREQRTLDMKLNEFLVDGWKLPRLDATMRAILRAGAYELQFRKDVPPPVTITEYVDVAKAFFDDTEAKFVNGVLDRYARWARDEDMK
ncbi:MAG TPA: transcription antitermination factor NusB [Rhizobiales bacterium]|nr:transcription antitermination factor NusB [Hyphomicrobiales bacterium]